MDSDDAKRLLDILIENAARILRAGFGVNSAESAFFSVIELMKTMPELKPYFLDHAAHTLGADDPGMLNKGRVPEELLELVAHELRWEEMQDLAEDRIHKRFGGDVNRALGDVSRRIIDANSRTWPDREFYSRYRAAGE